MKSGVERGAERNVHETDTQSWGQIFSVLYRLSFHLRFEFIPTLSEFDITGKRFNRYRTEKKFATGLCVRFVDISLRASVYSASHFSTEIRAREFAWPLKRRTVLYRLCILIIQLNYEKYRIPVMTCKVVIRIIKRNRFLNICFQLVSTCPKSLFIPLL